MGSGNLRSVGPVGEVEGREALLQMVRGAARSESDRQAEAVFVVCRWCGAEEFEVVARECFCFGCCLPLGVRDGVEEGFPGQYWWRLEPPDTLLPACTPGLQILPEEVCRCPEGHGVFELAIGFTRGVDHRIRRLSVGLRCPEDGGLHLYIDNAHVVPVERDT
ncbi:hypothetical protein OTB20_41065 [Streptomyces sp. H27-H1]|uniref:hypothetical protein n=1 Tax=Streptomyces sp. H27-H1 TaxID=2996461 RepID=UPI00226E4F80|nr:hypothetical protein [Streptomyces sp. H27-H1]MCY0932428.1 hypothetical protein [Streptomyces sp. H27-H1]